VTDAMIAVVLVARAALSFGVFSGLEITVESWATLARVFGWRSLKGRAEATSWQERLVAFPCTMYS
jgi:hypothetical protein